MLLIRYAKAWIRLHTGADIRQWSDEEVLDVFSMLPQPTVSPQSWLSLRSGLAQVQATPDSAPGPQNIFEANAAAIEGAKMDAKLYPDFISVKEANA